MHTRLYRPDTKIAKQTTVLLHQYEPNQPVPSEERLPFFRRSAQLQALQGNLVTTKLYEKARQLHAFQSNWSKVLFTGFWSFKRTRAIGVLPPSKVFKRTSTIPDASTKSFKRP